MPIIKVTELKDARSYAFHQILTVLLVHNSSPSPDLEQFLLQEL